MPRLAVVGPENSFLSRMTPWIYVSRALALVRILDRTAIMSSSSRLFSLLVAAAPGSRFGARLGHLHVPTMKTGAMPTAGKVIRKDVDEMFDQVDGGGKTRVRYRVVMNLAVTSYTQVSGDWYAVNLNVVSCANHNMMTFEGCFPDGFGSLVLVTLDFLYPEGIFSDVGGDRLGGRPRDGLPCAHKFSPVRWN